jgi:hypothetical protein
MNRFAKYAVSLALVSGCVSPAAHSLSSQTLEQKMEESDFVFSGEVVNISNARNNWRIAEIEVLKGIRMPEVRGEDEDHNMKIVGTPSRIFIFTPESAGNANGQPILYKGEQGTFMLHQTFLTIGGIEYTGYCLPTLEHLIVK